MNGKETYQGFKAVLPYIVCVTIMILFSGLLLFDGINAINHKAISYDDGYNATVAANMFRYGEYRVSYPEDICFYNMITTGETVILPTAVLFRLFGINNVTVSIVPLLYAILSVWAIWLLLGKVLSNIDNASIRIVSATAVTVCIVLSDACFSDISTTLLGEIASIFFLMVSYIMLADFSATQKRSRIYIAGGMISFAFLTKSSVIFFLVSMIGLMLAETIIFHRIKAKDFFRWILGIVLGFVFLDSFKFVQLGGIHEYLGWWKNEWANMLNQSSAIDMSYGINAKIHYLKVLFGGYSCWLCLLFVLTPVCLYIYYLLQKLIKRELAQKGTAVMLMAGVSGASLIIFFVLLGGAGLANARRQAINVIFIKIFIAYAIVCLLFVFLKDYRRKRKYLKIIVWVVLVMFAFPFSRMSNRLGEYVKRENCPEYEAELLNGFLQEVSELPADSKLYCAGWWQEPSVTLFLDRDMADIYDAVYGRKRLEDNSYFIVGRLIFGAQMKDIEEALNASLVRVDTSEVNYTALGSQPDEGGFDNYAIYKIVKNPPPQYKTGDIVEFTEDNPTGMQYVVSGISTPEDGFSWTDSATAELALKMSPEVEKCRASISVKGIMGENQNVRVEVNGHPALSKTVNGKGKLKFTFDNAENGQNYIIIYISDPVCPAEIGDSNDMRSLGLQISKMVIEEKK